MLKRLINVDFNSCFTIKHLISSDLTFIVTILNFINWLSAFGCFISYFDFIGNTIEPFAFIVLLVITVITYIFGIIAQSYVILIHICFPNFHFHFID